MTGSDTPPTLSPYSTISLRTIEESLAALDEVLAHPAQYALLLSDLLLRACQAYEDQNNNLSLTISWTIIEKLLRRMWSNYIEANREREIRGEQMTFINKARRTKLEGNDYTASVVAEILSLSDVLEPSLYSDIEIIRRARNKWLHGLKPPSSSEAELAIGLAQRMLSVVEGLDYELRVFQVHSFSSGLNPNSPNDDAG
jgi:hypothetical protein